MFKSTKTYGHEVGLSCAFRQWKADSHCQYLHGYALSVKLEFEAEMLDDSNWVMDFGGLKDIKRVLVELFDHTLVVAQDDPNFDDLHRLQDLNLARVVVLPAVGCEMFAKHIFDYVDVWLRVCGHKPRVRLQSVEVREHGANSAIYEG